MLITLMFLAVAKKSGTFSSLPCSADEQDVQELGESTARQLAQVDQ